MAIHIAASRMAIEHRPDDRDYWTVAPNGIPIKLPWSMMTRRQKELQLEAEKRAAYEALFDPNGMNAP